MEENKKVNKKEKLEEQNLEEITGGSAFGNEMPSFEVSNESEKAVRWDSKGNPTHWQTYKNTTKVGEPYHFVCPHCGRLLHEGAFYRLYCDPCDEGWFVITLPEGCYRKGIYPGC